MYVLANKTSVGLWQATTKPQATCSLLRNNKHCVHTQKEYLAVILTGALHINVRGVGFTHRPRLPEAGQGSCSSWGKDLEIAGV